ncbi:MAG: ribosomal protein S18-alanine N-acetyltransferase [Steroidobacteraceae bacterium]
MNTACQAPPLPELALRTMLSEDVPEVIKLEQLSYAFPWSEGIFRDCVRVGYTCCVAEIGGVLAGYGVLSHGAGEAHLLNVCVRGEFRHRGIGRRIMAHLFQIAARAGASLVFLEARPSNLAALRLYQSLGFTQIGVRRGYYQAAKGREDALVFSRTLGPQGLQD